MKATKKAMKTPKKIFYIKKGWDNQIYENLAEVNTGIADGDLNHDDELIEVIEVRRRKIKTVLG